ncbi:MAG: DUF4296 domain-containing protein [Bacteroidales bacterium]|jgi:hypothetical protein|nr:hypothetical protein [Lentimicrobiaceae bacterium]MDG1135387.1 DUF4296 domain-containing protein [Bacteroidales bacterium]MDG1901271.1 DUF4296 domain-containing protein [Bacteroidales bacterium]MDG2081547.1 DUF4296 domain-containing protein [Bacteroidales bacterium]|tara:strand:+ start:3432 stop:3890 length:459 start_codon:yes stop_codon:yes gene_type:complete
MKKWLALTFIVITISACYNINDKEIIIPEKLLSKNELATIMTEMQIAEASFVVNSDARHELSMKPNYYDAILIHYDITLDEIRDNINYYQTSHDDMEEIYETVLKNLSKLESDVEYQIKEMDLAKDSTLMHSDTMASDSVIIPVNEIIIDNK